MNRARSRIRCQIEQEEHDFVEDTGMKTVTFLIRMILESAIQTLKDFYL